MQAAGNLISASAELSAGMKHGKYHRNRRNAQLVMNTYGNAAAVVCNLYNIIGKDFHINVGAISRQSLVYGIVHNLVNKVVQSLWAG